MFQFLKCKVSVSISMLVNQLGNYSEAVWLLLKKMCLNFLLLAWKIK